jgi:hypothetical protein
MLVMGLIMRISPFVERNNAAYCVLKNAIHSSSAAGGGNISAAQSAAISLL